MRKIATILLAGGLLAGVVGSANAAPTQVFTDAAGDAGNQDSGVPGADQAGFDLVSGTIEGKGKNLEFTVTHAAMPASGSLPEGFRFLWHFTTGKDTYRFTVKSGDLGKPDVIGGSGQERVGQVDVDGIFRLETCKDEALPAVLTLINCETVQDLDGTFDPASASFTIVLPAKSIKAKKGTVISGSSAGAGASGCQICWVPHYAERSLTPHTIIDSTAQSVQYKVR